MTRKISVLLLLTFLLCRSQVHGQTKDSVFVTADPMPAFPGGEDSMFAYIRAYARYPFSAIENGTEGLVMISAVVNKDGWIEQPAVYKSVAWPLDSTALHVVTMMPPWIPGLIDNKPVSVKVFIPVKFKIEKASQVLTYAERMPTAGYDYADFIEKHKVYPQPAFKNKSKGNVVVRFVINKDGSISSPEVVRKIDPALDAEAIRVVKLMPKWQPGMENGQAVSCYFTLPIYFKPPETPSSAE